MTFSPKYALCHYSLHRTWKEEKLSCLQLAQLTKELGFSAIDFHVRLLGDLDQARNDIPAALAASGLKLSGLSLGNNFALEDETAFQAQIDGVLAGIQLAANVGAPVSRIFGGHLAAEDRADAEKLESSMQRILKGLRMVTAAAEKAGVILALENHGGLPATAAEQLRVLDTIQSPNLKATVDVGNYMTVEEEGHEALAQVVSRAAYIHFKDNKWGTPMQACTLGDGDVNHAACLRILEAANYQGFIALEYEGTEDERTGIRRSMDYLHGINIHA